MFHRLDTAFIEFKDERLYSQRFKDIFFAADGPNETARTFVEPARIRDRFARSNLFTIFELGFGTGLNFLVCAKEFAKSASSNSRLRFFSCEKYPLPKQIVERALSPWSSQLPLLDTLLESWPPQIPGWHRRHFQDGRIELSIFHGDVDDGINEFSARDHRGVDAWFLDGFAPERNPEMWQAQIFERMANLTNRCGTVTSFSSAGHVRKSLESAGFKVTRVEASPYKKHTTLAVATQHHQSDLSEVREVTVVGAGIAGASLAGALARKQVNVTLIDTSGKLAQQASSIPIAIQHGRLSSADTTQAEFKAHSYVYSAALSKQFANVGRCGALHIPNDRMPRERLNKVSQIVGPDWCRHISSDDCLKKFGVTVEEGAFFFPHSNFIQGPIFCRELTNSPRIRLEKSHVQAPYFEAIPTVLATGCHVSGIPPVPPLELASLDGQIDTFETLSPGRSIATVLVSNGYIVRCGERITAGSTYEYQPWVDGRATETNQNRIRETYPTLACKWESNFRGRRLVTSDRFPVAGRLTENLWLNIGYGSSGTTSAPFVAELLASEIVGEISPSSNTSLGITDPYRFALRQTRRPDPFKSHQNRF